MRELVGWRTDFEMLRGLELFWGASWRIKFWCYGGFLSPPHIFVSLAKERFLTFRLFFWFDCCVITLFKFLVITANFYEVPALSLIVKLRSVHFHLPLLLSSIRTGKEISIKVTPYQELHTDGEEQAHPQANSNSLIKIHYFVKVGIHSVNIFESWICLMKRFIK